jgi:hypothetical protein
LVEDVTQAADSPRFPSLLFFHQASVEGGRMFFAQRAPGSRAVADPSGTMYDAFGLRRMNVFELLRPSVWWCSLRAMIKGHFVGLPAGDTLRLPGAFLVSEGRVLWAHRARHAGHLPDLDAVVEWARTVGATSMDGAASMNGAAAK